MDATKRITLLCIRTQGKNVFLQKYIVTLCVFVSVIHTLQTIKCMVGSKPCLVFSGDLFETDSEYARLKNVLIGEHVCVCAHARSCSQCGYVLDCVGFYVCLYDVIKNCPFVISLLVNLLSVIYCYYLSLNSKKLSTSTCWFVQTVELCYSMCLHFLLLHELPPIFGRSSYTFVGNYINGTGQVPENCIQVAGSCTHDFTMQQENQRSTPLQCHLSWHGMRTRAWY